MISMLPKLCVSTVSLDETRGRLTDCPSIVHDTCYGEGRGRRTGVAKREAARQALEFFQENGVPGY